MRARPVVVVVLVLALSACRSKTAEPARCPEGTTLATGEGGVVSEGKYEADKPHGVWTAFSLHRTYVFATCLEHGEKRWQVTRDEVRTEQEALAKACP